MILCKLNVYFWFLVIRFDLKKKQSALFYLCEKILASSPGLPIPVTKGNGKKNDKTSFYCYLSLFTVITLTLPGQNDCKCRFLPQTYQPFCFFILIIKKSDLHIESVLCPPSSWERNKEIFFTNKQETGLSFKRTKGGEKTW